MRTTPIGMVLLNDERPHVTAVNEEINQKVLRRWAQVLRDGLADGLGTLPRWLRSTAP